MEADECEHPNARRKPVNMPLGGAFGTAPLDAAEDDEEDCHGRHALDRCLNEGGAMGHEHDGSNFLAKARQATLQGLAALKRTWSGEGGGGGGAVASSSSSSFASSSDTSSSSSSSSEEMEHMMRGAAKAVIETTARMKDEPPHLHAPELYHPEQVVSYAEMRSQVDEVLEAAKQKVEVDVREVMQTMIAATEAMKEEAGETFWTKEDGAGGRKNSLDNVEASGGGSGVVMEKEDVVVMTVQDNNNDDTNNKQKEEEDAEAELLLEELLLLTPE